MCFKRNFFKNCLSKKDVRSDSNDDKTASVSNIPTKAELKISETSKIEQIDNDNESLKYLINFFNNFQAKLTAKTAQMNIQFENDSKKIDHYLTTQKLVETFTSGIKAHHETLVHSVKLDRQLKFKLNPNKISINFIINQISKLSKPFNYAQLLKYLKLMTLEENYSKNYPKNIIYYTYIMPFNRLLLIKNSGELSIINKSLAILTKAQIKLFDNSKFLITSNYIVHTHSSCSFEIYNFDLKLVCMSEIFASSNESCAFYWFTYKDMFMAKKGSLDLLVFDINNLKESRFSSVEFKISANLNAAAAKLSETTFRNVLENEWDQSVGKLKHFNDQYLYFVNEVVIGDADQYSLNIVSLSSKANTQIWINASRYSSYSVSFDEESSVYVYTKAERNVGVYNESGALVKRINFADSSTTPRFPGYYCFTNDRYIYQNSGKNKKNDRYIVESY